MLFKFAAKKVGEFNDHAWLTAHLFKLSKCKEFLGGDRPGFPGFRVGGEKPYPAELF